MSNQYSGKTVGKIVNEIREEDPTPYRLGHAFEQAFLAMAPCIKDLEVKDIYRWKD